MAPRRVWWSAGLRARGRAERGRACEPRWRDSRWTGVARARPRRRCAAPPRVWRPALRPEQCALLRLDRPPRRGHSPRTRGHAASGGARASVPADARSAAGRASRAGATRDGPASHAPDGAGGALHRRGSGDPRSAGAMRAASARPTPSSRAVTTVAGRAASGGARVSSARGRAERGRACEPGWRDWRCAVQQLR